MDSHLHKNLVKALSQSGAVTKLYEQYPESYEGFEAWKAKAQVMWVEIGKVSDEIDPEIAKALNVK